MQVTVTLYASFRTNRFTTNTSEYQPVTTIRKVVRDLGIPENELGIVLVNSRRAELHHNLFHGDSLALFPVISGG